MAGLPPALAQQLQEVIEAWGQNQAQFSDWLGGVVNGGPNGDGRYPLTNSLGQVTSLSCPAAIVHTVTGPAAQADVARLAAEGSASSASASAVAADASKILADAAKTAALEARILAQTAQSHAATHEANARYWAERTAANTTVTSADRIFVEALAANTANAANSAIASASSAANSANLAATFNPALFANVGHTHAANAIVSGTIAAARLPAFTGDVTKPSGSAAQTLATVNANVGSFGSATASPVITVTAKGLVTAASSATITPAWTSVTGKPTTISGYGITDLITSITALDASTLTGTIDAARLPSTVFQGPIVAASNIASLTTAQQNEIRVGSTVVTSDGFFWSYVGGSKTTEASYRAMADTTPAWTAIADKPASFTPSAHTQDWSTITTRPTTLAGYGITDAAPKASPTFTGTITGGDAVLNSVSINTGYIYADGNHTVLKTGATAKYFRFDSNGFFYALNGGVIASDRVEASRHIATGGGIALRQKDSGAATGKALLHYKDASNYYMLLTDDGDADGSFNALRPFVLNLTTGRVSLNQGLTVTGTLTATGASTLNGNVTVGGSYIEVGAGNASNAVSSVLRRGSLELREAMPYIDLARDGTTDWHARIQSNSNGNLYLHSAAAVVMDAQNGAHVYANGGSGQQSGKVLTEGGTEQVVTKIIPFMSTDGFGAGHSSCLEARSNGGSGAGSEATMRFHRPGAYGSNFGLGTDNQYRHGGWSEGNQSWRFWTEKNLSMTNSVTGNTGVLRDGIGSVNVRSVQTLASAGEGLKFWNGSDDYKIYMSDEGNSTWGGNPPNAPQSDYNTYFRMTAGSNRGWVFYNGSAKAKIDGNGEATFSGVVRSSSWFYTVGQGLYDQSAGQGLRSAGSSGHAYGNLSVYGGGSNGWQGVNLRNDGVITWMCNGDTVGMHHSPNSWLIVGNMAGDFTFRGNVTAYSDLRLKTDARPIPDVVDRRDNLARAAIMYEREGRTRIGYGAQIVREGNPEFVHEADDAMKIADGTGTLSVDYGETTAVLAAASKLTDDRVSDLMAVIGKLEARITQLEKGA